MKSARPVAAIIVIALAIGAINISGYVQNQSELSGWLDPQKVLEF